MPGSTRTKTRITHDDSEAHRRLVGRVASALGATRVVLFLDDASGALAVAAAVMPAGEDVAQFGKAIAGWLDEASRDRRARLRHGPAGADRAAQRSCIVAPLVAGREVLGHLYVDVDGASGRFTKRELDVVKALAAAETASRVIGLENARLLDEKQRLLKGGEQHSAELAVINSIQDGVAGSLSFQGIVELVGETLRTVLDYQDLGIHWHDPDTDVDHALYVIERGERLSLSPKPIRPDGLVAKMRGDARRDPAARLAGRDRRGAGHLDARHDDQPVARLRADPRQPSSDRPSRSRELRPRARRRRPSPAADRRIQHGSRARERPTVRRDAAPAEGDRAAQRRAGGDQHGATRARWRAEPARRLRRRRHEAARGLPRIRGRHPALRRANRPAAFPVLVAGSGAHARGSPGTAERLRRRGPADPAHAARRPRRRGHGPSAGLEAGGRGRQAAEISADRADVLRRAGGRHGRPEPISTGSAPSARRMCGSSRPSPRA